MDNQPLSDAIAVLEHKGWRIGIYPLGDSFIEYKVFGGGCPTFSRFQSAVNYIDNSQQEATPCHD